jgi:hypothetical protein
MIPKPFRKWDIYVLILIFAGLLLSDNSRSHAQNEATEFKEDPVALMRDVSYNELKHSDAPRVRYELHKTDDKGTRVDEIIETSEGDVARHLSRNGEPLTGDLEKAEEARLNNLLAHPEIQEHRHKKEQEDSDRADGFIKLLPEAFLYKYEGIVKGLSGPAYRLTFVPNPNFIPPSAEAEVFHGMAGEVWVDCREKRLSRFDAHIIEDVNFGWGIAIRLFKGGTMLIEQVDAGDGRWEQKYFNLNLSGKILMVKTMTRKETETESNYVEIPPNTDYKAAINILKALPPAMP